LILKSVYSNRNKRMEIQEFRPFHLHSFVQSLKSSWCHDLQKDLTVRADFGVTGSLLKSKEAKGKLNKKSLVCYQKLLFYFFLVLPIFKLPF